MEAPSPLARISSPVTIPCIVASSPYQLRLCLAVVSFFLWINWTGPSSLFAQEDAETKKAFIQSRSKATPSPKDKTPVKPTSTPSSQKSKKKKNTADRSTKDKSKVKPKTSSERKGKDRKAESDKPASEKPSTPTPSATPKPSSGSSTPSPSSGGKTPTASSSASASNSATLPAKILISKTDPGAGEELPPPPPEKKGWWIFGSRPKYKYLTPDVKAAIDKAAVQKSRWRYVVVHNSGTRQGNAKAFDYYHTRVRKMPNGMAYHFVIGNGTSTGDGAIEIGNRWKRQINGGHVNSDFLNNMALGICLVGDFNRDKPTPAQMESLVELTRYLRKRVGKTERKEAIVKVHKDINPVPTDCPGDRFPVRWLYGQFE